jgi:flagellar P-ring protein precursor FlgI
METKRQKTKSYNYRRVRRIALVLLAVLTVGSNLYGLTQIRDICRPLGERTNKLIGYGVVVGLKGTGDSATMVATRPLREMLEKMGNPAEMAELNKTKNSANVIVTANLGRNGVSEGDTFSVQVSSLFDAKSLEGGMLLYTALGGASHASDEIYAWAQGLVTIPNAKFPTRGEVRGGAVMEADINYLFVDYESYPGKAVLTLVMDEDQANWQTAKAVADIINEETAAPGSSQADFMAGTNRMSEPTAVCLGPKNVLVTIPPIQARNPSPFITRILSLPVDLPDPEATVVINETAGVIVVTGNVEIAPTVVTVKDMTIQIVEPKPQPRPGQPVVSQSTWSKFDTTNTSTVKLQQLVDALDQLNVPIQDKINAIYEIDNAGALRGTIRREY